LLTINPDFTIDRGREQVSPVFKSAPVKIRSWFATINASVDLHSVEDIAVARV
jgi:hypothetical protein